ncbi:MAG: hypothetical protein ACREKR_13100 [Candidatus Methylomirabilales bacterium]
MTRPDGSTLVFSSDRHTKSPREFNVFIADWVPVLTRGIEAMSREERARRKPPSLRMRDRQKIWKVVPKLRKIKPTRPRG